MCSLLLFLKSLSKLVDPMAANFYTYLTNDTCSLDTLINGEGSSNGWGRQHFGSHRRAIGSGWAQIGLIHQREGPVIE